MNHRITTATRRARLVARHRLGFAASDVLDAVRGVVAVHSSDPLTPHLALRARVQGFRTEDLDRELCEARSLWRLHAMRRTLFVVPADEAGIFQGAAAADVARRERRKLERWLAAELDPGEIEAWIERAERRVEAALADGAELRTSELTGAVPELSTEITVGSGKWTTRAPVSSRILFLMAMEGRIVRTRPAGSWRSSQYGWAAAAPWFGRASAALDPPVARAALARRYLTAFGPATRTDLRWWTGWTAKQTDAALAETGAAAVALEGGGAGYMLPDDLDPDPEAVGGKAPVVALLPGLDPTPMGWKERQWFLGEHAGPLFDRNGNAGPTVWIGGRVVGAWAQRPDGEVVWRLLEDVGREAAGRVEAEAAALTEWMAGTVATPRFRTPLERELAG